MRRGARANLHGDEYRAVLVRRCRRVLHPHFDSYIIVATFRDENDETHTALTCGGNAHAQRGMLEDLLDTIKAAK